MDRSKNGSSSRGFYSSYLRRKHGSQHSGDMGRATPPKLAMHYIQPVELEEMKKSSSSATHPNVMSSELISTPIRDRESPPVPKRKKPARPQSKYLHLLASKSGQNPPITELFKLKREVRILNGLSQEIKSQASMEFDLYGILLRKLHALSTALPQTRRQDQPRTYYHEPY